MDKEIFYELYSEYFGDSPESLLGEYKYQRKLTKQLDHINVATFSRQELYEIILWKLNRFPLIGDEVIEQLKEISRLNAGEHKKGRDVVENLLRCHGIRLPMASTILRFINSEVFQIIDDRAYRVLCPGKEMYPPKPQKITDGYITKSIEIYFAYLTTLQSICDGIMPFSKADRILYQLDIEIGNKIGD